MTPPLLLAVLPLKVELFKASVALLLSFAGSRVAMAPPLYKDVFSVNVAFVIVVFDTAPNAIAPPPIGLSSFAYKVWAVFLVKIVPSTVKSPKFAIAPPSNKASLFLNSDFSTVKEERLPEVEKTPESAKLFSKNEPSPIVELVPFAIKYTDGTAS